MIIDIHTHIFPEKIVSKAISRLTEKIKLTPSMDATKEGLLKSQEAAGIDISVVLPTVTAARQFPSIINFAREINEEFAEHPTHGVFSLAGVHPDSPHIKEDLEQIKAWGFPGIKIHPDYQDTLFNDIRYKRILALASELDLFVITHAGYDVYSPDLVHCTVPMILEVLRDVQPTKLVLAHMGNNLYYDDVERDLLGADVYLDTAFSIARIPQDRMLRMIRRHGASKVLFGTDAPWSDQKEDVEILSRLGLTEEEYALVSHQNALDLLGLS